jgi:hypothetical protein
MRQLAGNDLLSRGLILYGSLAWYVSSEGGLFMTVTSLGVCHLLEYLRAGLLVACLVPTSS